MPEIGRSLLHYSIVGKTVKGGMGEVYRARDQKLGRDATMQALPDKQATPRCTSIVLNRIEELKQQVT